MINITALIALRDGVPAQADEDPRRAVEQPAVAPEQQQASAPSTYPAKSLVLKDGRYHVADHDK